MKFLAIFFLILLFSVNSFAQERELTIWTSIENVRNALLKITPQFEKEFNTKVNITILNKDLTSQFKTAALSGKGPDIFLWAHDVVGELAESGLIEPLDLSPALKSEFIDVALKAFTYKGKIYGYPYDLEAVALIYNKKIHNKTPSTMEELLLTAKKLTDEKKGEYGFLYDFANFFFSFSLFSAQGGYIFKDLGDKLDVKDVGLSNDGAVLGGEFIHKMVKDKIVPSSTDYSISFDKMKAGKLWATINGPWVIGDLKKSSIDYEIVPIPSIGGQVAKPFVGAHGLIVRRSSKNKELAKELIEKYIITKTGILALYEADPRGPARIDALEALKIKDPDLLKFMESAKVGIPMPNVPEMGAVWGAMGGAIRLIINGDRTSKEALTDATKQIRESLK